MEEEFVKEHRIKELTAKDKDEDIIKNVIKAKAELECAINNFEYAENDEYQMIRLPYHGGCEMTVYLPKDSVVADKWSYKDYLYQLELE